MGPADPPIEAQRAAEPVWSRRTAALAALAALGVVLVLASTPPPSTMAELLSPLSAQAPGQTPAVLIRLGVLYVSLDALRRRWRLALVVIALFLLSLVAVGAVHAFVLVAAVLVARAGAPSRSAMAVVLGAVTAGIAILVLPMVMTPEVRPDERDPAAMVAYWRGRRNPHQARWWAVEWAKQEASSPGNGLLTLAKLNWELGRRPQARRMLAKLLEQPIPDAIREAAEAERATWGAEGAAP